MPVMSEEWQIKNQELKRKWFLNNHDAINFINGLFLSVELWDDLIDKDVEVTDERINRCFLFLFTELTTNAFFVNNRYYLYPLMVSAINGFHDSNSLVKREDEKLRNLAFHIRNLGTELHIATAFLVGGYDHMRACSGEIREFFAFEDYPTWREEHV